MSDRDMNYPNWQIPLYEALLEFDGTKLAAKVQTVESAVSVRLAELSSETDHQAERQAIAGAVSTLSLLKNNLPGVRVR